MLPFHFRLQACGTSRSFSTITPAMILIRVNLSKIFRAFSRLFVLSLSLVFFCDLLGQCLYLSCLSMTVLLTIGAWNSMSLSSLDNLARCHNFFSHLFFDATGLIFFDASHKASFWRRCCCCGVLLQLSPPLTLPQFYNAAMLLLLLPCACAMLPLPLTSSLLTLSFGTDVQMSTFPRNVLYQGLFAKILSSRST